jgi:hypothetical protein
MSPALPAVSPAFPLPVAGMGGRFPPQRVKMSEEPREGEGSPLRRVAAIVRSWDGPNSRIGLELDLTQMPWGPFDALGKRLSLLLPAGSRAGNPHPASESQIERALRHVEHAADRCGEFAQMGNGNQDVWLRSQETWEWVRRYLTAHWLEREVDRRPSGTSEEVQLPALPGAASTLVVAAKALRATPLSAWRETAGPSGEEAPTREEAIQTLLGVARILRAGGGGEKEPHLLPEEPPAPQDSQPSECSSPPQDPPPSERSSPPESRTEPVASQGEETDPDQVSFDFARGYDEGYQMGRRVGLALGAKKIVRKGEA